MVFEFKKFKVMIDFAHNPAGYLGIEDFLTSIEAKKKIGAILAQTPTVALTTDCWTSGATESFICLSAHYVCPSSFTMMSWILATRAFNGRHTG